MSSIGGTSPVPLSGSRLTTRFVFDLDPVFGAPSAESSEIVILSEAKDLL